MKYLELVFSNDEKIHKLESKKYNFTRVVVDDKNKIDGFQIILKYLNNNVNIFRPTLISSLVDIEYKDDKRKDAKIMMKKDFSISKDITIEVIPPNDVFTFSLSIYYEKE